MPHMFVNRIRLYDLTKDQNDLPAHFRWETINAVLYKLGGLLFILGSVLFFPRLKAYADLGAWIFFIGSLLYLVVTVHDLAEVRHKWRITPHHGRQILLEYTAAFSYVAGTVLFTIGSILFLSFVGFERAGAWMFVTGSLLFVLGASINVLQIVRSKTLLSLQLMNLTAVTFVVGSVLFTVASIPYLWHVQATADRRLIDAFLAWQYLVGSLLFFLGGVFNYWRAYALIRDALRTASPKCGRPCA